MRNTCGRRLQTRERAATMQPEEQPGTDDAVFESIMAQVGSRGRFQRRYNIVFNMLFIALVSMPYYNFVMALAIPDHWCRVPGRGATNLTAEQWRDLTVPREEGPPPYSQCSMYNTSHEERAAWLLAGTHNGSGLQVVPCQHGWEYDRTWYAQTAPSQHDWVCDQELVVANLYTFDRLGEIAGNFVMGQLGDRFGRRPILFGCLALLITTRLASGLSSGNHALFLAATLVGSVPSSTVFQTPLILGIEISAMDQRSMIALLQACGWTAGMCLMPLVFWALSGEWTSFMVVTTLPCAIYLLAFRWFPESPRWLASTGRISACVEAIRAMARTNGTHVSEAALAKLRTLSKARSDSHSLLALFSSWRLAKNSVLVILNWTVGELMYYILTTNVTNISGNPFTNFFWQSLVELPGCVLGRILSEKLGRRWTQAGVFVVATVAQIVIIFISSSTRTAHLVMPLVTVVKLAVTIASYSGYLQAMEVFPTCIRQTGCSMGSLVSGLLGTLGPYIIYLGAVTHERYTYVVMAALTLFGALVATLMPETLGQELPETLEDAANFGKHQEYWRIHQRRPARAPAAVNLRPLIDK
ncbi:organic cation/carnitine transporter 2-like [Bacillus rossius redtenbacheri]|uniref:organic cation/carnitine transporter 2-like n=1 Tax=Bacillus rossius redtenbacheri TaxID=93214 RepID=UPI002FDCCC27